MGRPDPTPGQDMGQDLGQEIKKGRNQILFPGKNRVRDGTRFDGLGGGGAARPPPDTLEPCPGLGLRPTLTDQNPGQDLGQEIKKGRKQLLFPGKNRVRDGTRFDGFRRSGTTPFQNPISIF